MCCSLKWIPLLLGFIFIAALSHEQATIRCGRRIVNTAFLIHNGNDAVAGHWPWHVALFHQNEYKCGGSILDHNTILTASHCVSVLNGVLPTSYVSVHVGRTHLKESSNWTQIHDVKDIILHPEFMSNSNSHDIALIKLSSSITMNMYVQPVCLWTMDSKQQLIVGRNGTIVGFGYNEQDAVSNKLKQAMIGVVDPLTCIASDRPVFGGHLTVDMFCGLGQNGVGACNGDSGGGMFFEEKNRWFVRGMVSFSPMRGVKIVCDPLKPTVYTDVAKYVEWIKQYIDHRVLPSESDVFQIDYGKKQLLFNFTTCGLKSTSYNHKEHYWTLPWIGTLYQTNESHPRCTATLISEWYAVGPAHCFNNDEDKMFVVLGDYREYPRAKCFYRNGKMVCSYLPQRLKIEKVIVHPNFDLIHYVNNIALIVLQSPADITQPNVKPICMPLTDEFRTNATTNLFEAAFAVVEQNFKNVRVARVDLQRCIQQFGKYNIALSQEYNILCAEIPNKKGCKGQSLQGAPIQERKLVNGTAQYFLRGFDMLGWACRKKSPTVHINVEPYIDWILFEMEDKKLEPPRNSTAIQTLESEWKTLRQQPGYEKLRLFNMDTCGISSELLHAILQPWIGHLMFKNTIDDIAIKRYLNTTVVILISEWYALAPKRVVQMDKVWRYVLLGQYLSKPTNGKLTYQMLEIKNIIIPPKNHPRQLFALIELLEPANVASPYIRPICLPFMKQLQREKPKLVEISAPSITTSFITTKNLTIIDHTMCKFKLLLETKPVTLEKNLTCAIEAEKFTQKLLYTKLGIPFQIAVPFNGHIQYFLYGMDTNAPGRFKGLIFGPYLFDKIESADLELMLEHVQEKQVQTSFINPTVPVRVNVKPIHVSSFERNLIDLSTCGVSSSSYPAPWIGRAGRCSVTLVTEWFVVGPANCSHDESEIDEVVFAENWDSLLHRSCAETNHSEPCAQRIKIQKIIRHPHYTGSNYVNDIALLQLVTPVNTSLPNVRPICLPIFDAIRSYNTSSLVMVVSDDVTLNHNITNVGDRYVESADCQMRWEGLKANITIYHRTNHCVITQRSSNDECIEIAPGASLHSLQTLGSSERSFLRGFVVDKDCFCSIYYPVVYTKTDGYLEWIVDVLSNETVGVGLVTINSQQT